ncbi:uncharacterized protein LOC124903317 [Homo sapiens]|uniref:uncharacterized protein LOC124903317 n=1 Tax=Homo sapiens TaxID=9606 RepID=UPI001FB10E45|nr:uncharacterized protein LOC124903317 [Homo sapiens]
MIEARFLGFRKSTKIARGEGASCNCSSQALRAPRQLGARLGDTPLDAASGAARTLQRPAGLRSLPQNLLQLGVLSPSRRRSAPSLSLDLRAGSLLPPPALSVRGSQPPARGQRVQPKTPQFFPTTPLPRASLVSALLPRTSQSVWEQCNLNKNVVSIG